MSATVRPGDIAVRPAAYEDARAIKEVARAHRYTAHFSHPAYCNRARFQEGAILVAEQDGAIVGFAACRFKKRKAETELDILGVAEARRSCGIGAALLAHLRARGQNIVLNVKHDNPRARTFYDREGFVVLDPLAQEGTSWRMIWTSPTRTPEALPLFKR